MATLSGTPRFDAVVYQTNAVAGVTANLIALDLSGDKAFVVIDDLPGGSLVAGTPVSIPTSTLAGNRLKTFVDDYYDRIHLSPISFNVGNVTSQQTRQFTLWNAWRVPVTVSSIIYVNPDGWHIEGMLLVNDSIAPLVATTYDLIVARNGPPIINGSVTMTFNTGESKSIGVDGKRVILMSAKPNWKDNFIENYDWLTDVMQAWDGTEQRRRLRNEPRRSFEFSTLLYGKELRKFEALVYSGLHLTFSMPLWIDECILSSQSASGSSVINSDLTYTDFAVDDIGILYVNDDNYEVFEVQSSTSSQITTKFPLQATWPAGTKMYPLHLVMLNKSQTIKRYTDDKATAKIFALSEPSSCNTNLPTVAAAETYDGLEVITIQPDWGEAIDNEFTREFMTADFGVGPAINYEKESFTRITRDFKWLLKSKAEIKQFKGYLKRMNGRQKTCWIPSWHDDLTMADTIGSTEVTFDINSEMYTEVMLSEIDTTRDRLRIELNDGTIFYRKILNLTDNVTHVTLTLNQSFGMIITTDMIKRICFLLKCRFATDKVIIPWRTMGVATPKIAMTTVRA